MKRKRLASIVSALLLGGVLAVGFAVESSAASAATGPLVLPARAIKGSPVRARADRILPHIKAVPLSSVNGSCSVWTDGTTYGSACRGLGSLSYQAEAVCNNGQIATGPFKGGTSGAWSYAYCSTYHSTIKNALTSIVNGGAPLIRRSLTRAITRSPVRAQADRILPHIKAAPSFSINGSCSIWTDGTTFGTACTGMEGLQYRALGACSNGASAYGPVEYGESDTWSYAYCSTYHSTVAGGAPAIYGI
jgi:hypothetical protein